MAPKSSTSDGKSARTTDTFSQVSSTLTEECGYRCASLELEMMGNPIEEGDYRLLAMYNGSIILDESWRDASVFEIGSLLLNYDKYPYRELTPSSPIIFLLRAVTGKASKPDDPLVHSDNRGGGTVDLLPLYFGEEEIFTTVHLVSITSEKFMGCQVMVNVKALDKREPRRITLLLSMLSAHYLPPPKEGTVYISAVGLSDLCDPVPLSFGQSLSTANAKKLVWATASNAGFAANTAFSVPNDSHFVPEDLNLSDAKHCRSVYWNSLNRALVNPEELLYRLNAPFFFEMAGVPITGKSSEVRGRYMGWADARTLLEPGQMSVTVCIKLLFYNEKTAPEYAGLLDLPPASAKTPGARDFDLEVVDEHDNVAYAVLRFDITSALVPRTTIASLYEFIGFPLPEGSPAPVDSLDISDTPAEPFVDVRLIRKEGGALAVHKELSNLACHGNVPMNQSIKRSAANRLLMRVRAMLKNFAPGDCSYIEWQDTVTGQHAASRRAVVASFACQAPPPRPADRTAAARCRIAGDKRLAEKHMKLNLKISGNHPRALICQILRCLEERNDLDATNYLYQALNVDVRKRYLLWILGAQEFDKGEGNVEIAEAAFKIAAKGDYSNGTGNAIAWAALHSFYHYTGHVYAAHVAAKQMRKSFSLPKEWDKVLKRWVDASGEEEVYWTPKTIACDNPILIAAAFFLCLRCFKFCDHLLKCVRNDCATRGTNDLKCKKSIDKYYIKAASLVIRRQFDSALDVIDAGTRKYGPSAAMSQMYLTCLSRIRQWDGKCQQAYKEAERAGAIICPSVLYKAALSEFKSDPIQSLQKAAQAHKEGPSGHTALLVGRIYLELGEHNLAERWCAGAVKLEPYLADGWAMLSIMGLYQRNSDKARTMLRTAKQVGPISPDIQEELRKLMDIVGDLSLPESIVKDLCIKKRYD